MGIPTTHSLDVLGAKTFSLFEFGAPITRFECFGQGALYNLPRYFTHTETSFNPPENFERVQRPEAGRGAGLRPPAKLPALLVQSPASHVG